MNVRRTPLGAGGLIDRHGYRNTGLFSPDDISGGCDPVYFAMLAFLPTLLILASMSGSTIFGAFAMAVFFLEYGVQNKAEEEENSPKFSTALNAFMLLVGLISVVFFLHGLAIVGLVAACTLTAKYLNSRIAERKALAEQDAVFAADSASHLVPIIEDAEAARVEQNAVALKDTTPFINLSTALGFLIKFGDIFSPDAFLPMGLSVKDRSYSLLHSGQPTLFISRMISFNPSLVRNVLCIAIISASK